MAIGEREKSVVHIESNRTHKQTSATSTNTRTRKQQQHDIEYRIFAMR